MVLGPGKSYTEACCGTGLFVLPAQYQRNHANGCWRSWDQFSELAPVPSSADRSGSIGWASHRRVSATLANGDDNNAKSDNVNLLYGAVLIGAVILGWKLWVFLGRET